jgi:hypothetical protein
LELVDVKPWMSPMQHTTLGLVLGSDCGPDICPIFSSFLDVHRAQEYNPKKSDITKHVLIVSLDNSRGIEISSKLVWRKYSLIYVK